LVAVVVLAFLAFAAATSAKVPEAVDEPKGTLCPPPADGSKQTEWCALDKVEQFKSTLNKAGFDLKEAGFEYVDLVDLNCQDQLFTSLANNPWPNAYIVMTNTQLLEDRTNPLWQKFWDKFPWFWQLREDEAFVMVGQTPPEARYFSFGTTAMFTPGDEWTPTPIQVTMAQVGDNVNRLTIHTLGPDAFDAPIVYIITGNRETERRVRAAARAAGYPDAIINVETISPVIAPLGIGPQSSIFFTVARAAVAKDEAAMETYIKDPPMKAFRLTPKGPTGHDPTEPVLPPDLEPVPVLRPKGTGHTEMELWPAVQRLRKAILQHYTIPGSSYKELDTKIWSLEIPLGDNDLGLPIPDLIIDCQKPWASLQRGINALACHRDNNYLATYPNFKLPPGGDDFVIVYGVNHQATGKAAYGSFSLYVDAVRWLGIGTKTSPNFDDPDGSGPLTGEPGDSARYYLGDDPDAQYLYAWKVARHCNEGEPFCMEIADPVEFERPDGSTYTCKYVDPEMFPGVEIKNFNDEMFFIFRNYMEPATKVGPDDNELVYDRAIYFGPYFTP
jgi:hypothetical protein